jgi:hypothetical protein
MSDCESAVRGVRPRMGGLSISRPVMRTSASSSSPGRQDGATDSKTPTGEIQEGETWGNRMVKDVATGACRGGAWELYQFFVNFRF